MGRALSRALSFPLPTHAPTHRQSRKMTGELLELFLAKHSKTTDSISARKHTVDERLRRLAEICVCQLRDVRLTTPLKKTTATTTIVQHTFHLQGLSHCRSRRAEHNVPCATNVTPRLPRSPVNSTCTHLLWRAMTRRGKRNHSTTCW